MSASLSVIHPAIVGMLPVCQYALFVENGPASWTVVVVELLFAVFITFTPLLQRPLLGSAIKAVGWLNPPVAQAVAQKYDPALGQLPNPQFFHRSISIVTENHTFTGKVPGVA